MGFVVRVMRFIFLLEIPVVVMVLILCCFGVFGLVGLCQILGYY